MDVNPNLTAIEYANCERCGVVRPFVRGAAHRCARCSETLASIDAVSRNVPELPMTDEQIATRMRATHVDPNWATTYVDPELAAIPMGLQAGSEPAHPNALAERDHALRRAKARSPRAVTLQAIGERARADVQARIAVLEELCDGMGYATNDLDKTVGDWFRENAGLRDDLTWTRGVMNQWKTRAIAAEERLARKDAPLIRATRRG